MATTSPPTPNAAPAAPAATTAAPDKLGAAALLAPAAVPAPAPAVAPAAAEAAGGAPTQAHSLEKLMAHIESLKKSNHEMNSALTAIIDGNKDKLRSMLASKIEPWIKSLQIPEEHQKAFLHGIEAACQEGHYKGMADFEKNPAFTVACAAAAAHGQATADMEATRQQLKDYMQETEAKSTRDAKTLQDRHSDEHRMLYVAAGAGSSDAGASLLGKRAAPEVYADNDGEMASSKCWNTVFSNLRP